MNSRPKYEQFRDSGLKPKDLVGIPWRVAFALQADGWWLRSDIIWSKTNPMPESVTDRPTKAHEYVFLLSKSKTYYYDTDAVREPVQPQSIARGERREQLIQSQGVGALGKQQESLRQGNNYAFAGLAIGRSGSGINPAGRNRRTVWTISTKPYAGAHFATYPPALVEPCIKAGTSEQGVCPECGAGWKRVVERKAMIIDRSLHTHSKGRTRTSGTMVSPPESHTIGWQPACNCCQVCNHYNQLHGRRKCPVPYDPIPAPSSIPLSGQAPRYSSPGN